MWQLIKNCLPTSLQCVDDEEMKDPLLDGISKVSQANEFSFEADNLSKSILKGDIHEVKASLSETTAISINERNSEGNTALCVSISSQQPKIAKLLLDLGANPNGTCLNGNTALHIAVQICNIECIALLSQFHVDCNVLNHEHISPLYIAVEQNNYQLVDLLIRMGASCFPQNFPLFIVNTSSSLKLSHNNHSVPSSPSKSKKRRNSIVKPILPISIPNPILLSCSNGSAAVFQLLCIQLFNEIEQKLIKEYPQEMVMGTPEQQQQHSHLSNSPRNQEEEQIEKFDEVKQYEMKQNESKKKHSLSLSTDSSLSISQEAESYFRQIIQSIMDTSTQCNLLLTAAQKGHVEIVDFLLKHEIFDVNETYPVHNHWSVLHFAVASGNEKLVRLLIQQYNCNINNRDEIGRTALHYASAKGFAEMVSVLIELNADVNVKDDGDQYTGSSAEGRVGKTALDLAIESINYHKVARAFRFALQEREARQHQQYINTTTTTTTSLYKVPH